jgi:hypothetical protein
VGKPGNKLTVHILSVVRFSIKQEHLKFNRNYIPYFLHTRNYNLSRHLHCRSTRTFIPYRQKSVFSVVRHRLRVYLGFFFKSVFFSPWRCTTHSGCVFYSPLSGFSLLACEVTSSLTATRHSR